MRRFTLIALVLVFTLAGCFPVGWIHLPLPPALPGDGTQKPVEPTDQPPAGVLGVVTDVEISYYDDGSALVEILVTKAQLEEYMGLQSIDPAELITEDVPNLHLWIPMDHADPIIGPDLFQAVVDVLDQDGVAPVDWYLTYRGHFTAPPDDVCSDSETCQNA